MKIINKTHWQTKDLAAIIRKVATDELEKDKLKRCVFTVVYGRTGRGSSGYAYYGGTRARLRIPSGNPRKPRIKTPYGWKGFPPEEVDLVDFAYVVGHECGHLRGLHHGAAMHSARYSRDSAYGDYRQYYAWAGAMPLRKKEKKLPPTVDQRREKKALKANLQLRVWERREKLAKTKVKKYRLRVRRLEKIAAVGPAQVS